VSGGEAMWRPGWRRDLSRLETGDTGTSIRHRRASDSKVRVADGMKVVLEARWRSR